MKLRAGTPARDLGLVFIGGPALGVVGALATGAPRANLAAILIVAAVAWAIGGALLWGRLDRANPVWVAVALFVAVVLVSIGVVYGGPPSSGLTFFYLWGTPLAFVSLSRRMTAAYVVVLAVCFAGVIYVEVTMQGSPLRLNFGRWLYVVGTVCFVGLIVRATALRAARVDSRFRRTFDDSPIGQTIMDGNGNYLDVNEAFARIVGRSTTAVVGLNLREVTHPDDVALSESAFVAAMSDKPAVNFQKQYVRPDGSVRTASITYSALGEPRDAGRQVYAHVLDVTDEVEATRATKASEAELTDTRSRYTRQQEALAQLGQAALDSREIPKLLQFGCELAVEALGVAFCGVPNVTTGRTTLDIVAAAGRGAQGLKGWKFPIPDDGITTLMRNPSTTVRSSATARMRASNKDWESLDGVLASALILDDSRSIWRLVIATTAPFVLSADDVGFLNSVAAILGSAIARQESDERRRELVMRLVVAQEDERARIAGEIHDDSLQAVAASRVQVHRLRNSLAGEAAERADVVEHVLGEASERLRDLLFRLSPQDINTKGGLESALTELAARTAKEHQLKVTLEVRGDLDLEPGMRVLVYRTVQEALVNTLKHAAAHEAWVAVERTAREATISVRDDGSGFDSLAPPATGHIGLLAARTRIDDAGGTLTLASGVGLGTTIEVRLPLGGAA